MKIFKYPLDLVETQTRKLRNYARLLCVQVQNGRPTVWAEVDENAKEEDFVFVIKGTGHDAPPEASHEYIGTVQIEGFVWHVYFRPL